MQANIAVPAIPYFPIAFPDELMGSWLSRFVILNAEPSFANFARTLSLNVNAKSSVADPLNSAHYVRALASMLRIEHDSFVSTFTTKAYWDTFRPASVGLELNRQLKHSKPRLSPPMLRVCPACIEADLRTVGFPYFHRTHQLRSRACPHHKLMLQDSCTCGRPLCSSNEPTLMPIQCVCGKEVISNIKRETANKGWYALAKFSHNALYALPGELELLYLSPYAVSQAVADRKLSIGQSIRSILIDSYGIEGLDWLCRRPGAQGIKYESRVRKFSISQLAPHLVIAILAGCGIDFDEAKNLVAAQKSLPPTARLVPQGARGPKSCFRPTSISEAQQFAQEFTTDGHDRGDLKAKRPFVYWMLYLNARPWLYDWMHEGGHRTVSRWDEPPSIMQDRTLILGNGARLARQAARARAYTRDRKWLNSKDSTRTQQLDRATTIIESLAIAKAKHHAEVGRPKKWTVSEAAKRLRMPNKTLTAFAQRNKEIRALVPELPQEFLFRVINWTIAECIQKGLDLTPLSVLKKGGLLINPTTMKFCTSVIENRSKDYASIAK
ncbi:TniQ family protein [Noviherbaspirillum sp. 1P10PC]|uniref:TniQ family protein n=1 Tax=Noviherbaspirillum sp. 1P10PC TaxID=3132292 RepID=UPI00399F33CF